MRCKEGQFNVVNWINKFKDFSINLNTKHVNGIPHFDIVRLLETLEQ